MIFLFEKSIYRIDEIHALFKKIRDLIDATTYGIRYSYNINKILKSGGFKHDDLNVLRLLGIVGIKESIFYLQDYVLFINTASPFLIESEETFAEILNIVIEETLDDVITEINTDEQEHKNLLKPEG